MRIGIGYDLHRLVVGRKLILGGVEFAGEKGLLGHSDADVLTHAVIDALLGAAALGDIGAHFPDSKEEFAGVSSILLLKKTAKLLAEAGFVLVNLDTVVVAQEPKLTGQILQMRKNLAQALECELSQVSVKATTEEGLGATGTGQGIAAKAIALIEEKNRAERGKEHEDS